MLASTVPSSSNYDVVNETLLTQGGDVLTLDLTQGLGLDPDAVEILLEAAESRITNLRQAARSSLLRLGQAERLEPSTHEKAPASATMAASLESHPEVKALADRALDPRR